MEKYKYTLVSKTRSLDTVEAQDCTEAMQKFGIPQYVVEHQFPFMCIVRPPVNKAPNLVLAIRWEPVKK